MNEQTKKAIEEQIRILEESCKALEALVEADADVKECYKYDEALTGLFNAIDDFGQAIERIERKYE